MHRTRTMGFISSLPLYLVAAAAQGATPASALVEYSRDPNTVVMSLNEVLGEIADADPGPSLEIYGDGRAVVHFPHYMRRAGDHSMRLSAAEMARLLRAIVDLRFVEFDADAAKRGKQETDAARTELRASTDPSVTTITLRLDRYRPASQIDPERVNVEQRIAWLGLRSDARAYPGVKPIQDLAAVWRELWAVMEHPSLTPID